MTRRTTMLAAATLAAGLLGVGGVAYAADPGTAHHSAPTTSTQPAAGSTDSESNSADSDSNSADSGDSGDVSGGDTGDNNVNTYNAPAYSGGPTGPTSSGPLSGGAGPLSGGSSPSLPDLGGL